MSVQAGGILDTRNTLWNYRISTVQTQTGNVGERSLRRNVAAEQSSFIRHDGVDDYSLLISKRVRALLIPRSEGKTLSLVSLVLDDMALGHGECPRKSTKAKVKIVPQRS